MADFWDKITSSSTSVDESKTVSKKKPKQIDCKNLKFTLTQQGIKADLYELQDLNLDKKLINYFTIHVNTITGYIKHIRNHTRCNTDILFPRFGVLEYLKTNCKNYAISNKLPIGEAPKVEFKWNGAYKNNQPIVASHIMKEYFSPDRVKSGSAGLILNLEAGQGKSYTAAGLMQELQKKTLIICHNKSIMNQWVKLLHSTYPNNKIGHYYGELHEDGDIVVAIINSLLMDKLYIGSGGKVADKQVLPPEFFKRFGFVVLDEVHEYCGVSRKKIYQVAQCQYMLGLSATPDEKQFHMDNINIWNCGPILDASTLAGYSVEDIPFTGEVTMIKYKAPDEYTNAPINEKLEIINFAGLITQICDDPYRVHIIVKAVFELRKNNNNIFIFADRRSYLTKIKEEMDIFQIATEILADENDSEKVIQLMGGSSAADMEHAREKCNVILTTYQYLGTGASIPKMDAIVLTTPRKSKSKQFINRIFRLGSDYSVTRKIIDIVDWSTCAKSQWYKRKKYYAEKGYPITISDVNWEDIDVEMTEMGLLEVDPETTLEDLEEEAENAVLSRTLDELEALLRQSPVLNSI